MFAALFTAALAATGALANPLLSEAATSHGLAKRCTPIFFEVPFHFNDTSIGSCQSSTQDVMYRGEPTTSSAKRHPHGGNKNNKFLQKLSGKHGVPKTYDDDDDEYCVPQCVDGPIVSYTVVSGDTLEAIAANFDSGVCNIAALNGLDNPDFILVDQVLEIPTEVCVADNDSCRTAEGTATCVPPDNDLGVGPTYTIVAGDTFFLLASRFGITLDALTGANPGVDASTLQVGQVINVPICDS